LNPAREGEIRPTSDYPKGYFGAVREDPGAYDFILAEFALPEKMVAKLASMTGLTSEVLDVVRVGRDYKNTTLVRFPKYLPIGEIDSKELMTQLVAARGEIAGMTVLQKEATTLHPALLATIDEATEGLKSKEMQGPAGVAAIVARLSASVPEATAPTSTIVPRMKRLIEEFQAITVRLDKPSPHLVEGVHKLVWDSVPRFVFYSNYGNLDSEIYLPHVVDNLKREDLGAKEAAKARTLRVLFKFVRLEPEEILELGRDFREKREPTDDEIVEIADKKRERTILLNSAGTELTKKFREWWKQGDYTFDFQADGDHFRILGQRCSTAREDRT